MEDWPRLVVVVVMLRALLDRVPMGLRRGHLEEVPRQRPSRALRICLVRRCLLSLLDWVLG